MVHGPLVKNPQSMKLCGACESYLSLVVDTKKSVREIRFWNIYTICILW